MDFGPLVRQETTLKASVRVASSLEYISEGRTTNNVEDGGKINNEESWKSNKKNRFSKSSPNNKEPRGNNEMKWCARCQRKHFGKYIEEVTCFKCGEIDPYTNKCKTKQESCFRLREVGHVMKNLLIKGKSRGRLRKSRIGSCLAKFKIWSSHPT